MLLQFAETQIDAAHEPEHLPGQMHGHTWMVRVYQKIEPEKGWVPDITSWRMSVRELVKTLDHCVLPPGRSLCEHIALYVGVPLGAAKVVVWRKIDGEHAGIEWTP